MTYSKNILFDAQHLLETICPGKLLLIGESVRNIADDYIQQCSSIHRQCEVYSVEPQTVLSDQAYNQSYDLVIISDLLETSNKQHAEQLLAKIRNLCSPRIILLSKANSQWSNNELLALSLIQFAKYDDGTDNILYQYNLDTYKKTPDWFNPKNWANPENWDKFWW